MQIYKIYLILIFDTFLDSAKFPRDQFSEDVQQVPKNAPLPITPLSVTLTSEENMYSNMRDSNFRSIGRILSKKAREISAAFEVSRNINF